MEEYKEETLEEAGLRHCDMLDEFPALANPLFSFKQGAKWQQERMYTEEDLRQAMIAVILSNSIKNSQDITKYIEQLKKK